MSTVLVSHPQPDIAVLRLNDPDRLNAMSLQMASDFKSAVEALAPDRTRAIIVTGAGRAFSAGGDLKMLLDKADADSETNRVEMLRYYDCFLSIRELGVPVIAAINGHAIGAGMCLAAACDMRIVAAEAKLGVTFTRLGLHPGMGATHFIPRLLGRTLGSDLLMSGRVVGSALLHAHGFASALVPSDDVLEEAMNLALEIARCGPYATRLLVETLRRQDAGLPAALAAEASQQALSYASDEFREGVSAMRDKRRPLFDSADRAG